MKRRLMFTLIFGCSLWNPAFSAATSQGRVEGDAQKMLRSGSTMVFPRVAAGETGNRAARNISAKWIQSLVVEGTIKVPIDIQNAILDGDLILEGIVFKQRVSFRSCTFRGQVSFGSSTFEGNAAFLNSFFEQKVSFDAAQANRDLRLSGSIYKSDASFMDLHVHESLSAKGTQFQGIVNFGRAEVQKSVFFDADHDGPSALFLSSAKFRAMHVHGAVAFSGSHFLKDSDFQNLQVNGSAFFDTAEFKGLADFTLAHVDQNAIFLGTKFYGDSRFDWVKIDGAAQFWQTEKGQPTEFWGESDFASAAIGNDATFRGTYFAKNADFQDVDFKGSTEFTLVQFKEEANFSGARFSKELAFNDTKFWGPATFLLTIGRDIRLPNTEFRKVVTFREAHFQVLYFGEPATNVGSPSGQSLATVEKPTKFFESNDLAGLTYERVYGDFDDMLKKLAPFERQPYVQLEQYLRKVGADEEADTVYLERRTAEGRRISFWRHPAARLSDLLYRYAANYGILNWQLVSLALLAPLLGCVVYSKAGTVNLKKESCQAATLFASASDKHQAKTSCSSDGSIQLSWREALAFSIHEFLPLTLPLGDQWVPTPKKVYIKISSRLRPIYVTGTGYSSFLKVAGWIIVPVAIAALTGILRRGTP